MSLLHIALSFSSLPALAAARRFWALTFLALVFLAYFVPFALLTNVYSLSGAFLFWWIYIIVIIACIWAIASKWRD